MADLRKERCAPLPAGTPPLPVSEAQALLRDMPDWQLAPDGKALAREFRFRNYYETIAFVNALAFVANQQDHHPDLEVHYNRCLVRYSTHSVGGLSRNDFICAARIDALLE
jgi:4a-hydroxytetrahydrobiopterin dehydratase